MYTAQMHSTQYFSVYVVILHIHTERLGRNPTYIHGRWTWRESIHFVAPPLFAHLPCWYRATGVPENTWTLFPTGHVFDTSETCPNPQNNSGWGWELNINRNDKGVVLIWCITGTRLKHGDSQEWITFCLSDDDSLIIRKGWRTANEQVPSFFGQQKGFSKRKEGPLQTSLQHLSIMTCTPASTRGRHKLYVTQNLCWHLFDHLSSCSLGFQLHPLLSLGTMDPRYAKSVCQTVSRKPASICRFDEQIIPT